VTQREEGFTPKHDGFAFKNLFKGSPLPAAIRDASTGPLAAVRSGLDAAMGLPSEFGLCGGMVLAAADHYLAQVPVPDDAKAPEPGSQLYEYLYQRQADSMGELGVVALKFWRWMKLPDRSETGESTAHLTGEELPAITERLKARQLVPIGLVLVSEKDGGHLWENHQVLGYGIREGEKGSVDLLIYDPNFPQDDKVVIRVTPVAHKQRKSGREFECRRITGKGTTKIVRGFFALPYEPMVPPRA
jgi:hypothetical protein